MTTKAQLIAACKQNGVMLLDDGEALRLDAPIGKVFKGTGNHAHDLYLQGWKRTEAYEDLIGNMLYGMEDCADPDCDACVHEPSDFDAIQKLYGGERLA